MFSNAESAQRIIFPVGAISFSTYLLILLIRRIFIIAFDNIHLYIIDYYNFIQLGKPHSICLYIFYKYLSIKNFVKLLSL